MGLISFIQERRELAAVKKCAKKVARQEAARFDSLIDKARDDCDPVKIAIYGFHKNGIREGTKRIVKSNNPMEVELCKTGISLMSVSGRIIGKKVDKGGK